ncbi:hypothetical protein B0O99DRAFT_239977 [Bisporella sp. PMI_857]|nr:hypothetical protein B0O99DRAFT_239977 [Bisporella sp. PMI_857]
MKAIVITAIVFIFELSYRAARILLTRYSYLHFVKRPSQLDKGVYLLLLTRCCLWNRTPTIAKMILALPLGDEHALQIVFSF